MNELDNFFNHHPSSVRSIVIDHAVKVEHHINGILASILGLSNKSVAFGSTSQALPFSQKITLLLDLQILAEDQKKKITTFSEIRNKFAHILAIQDFSDCPDSIKVALLKFYSTKENPLELAKCYELLYQDVKKCSADLLEKVKKMASDKGELMGRNNFFQILTLQIASEMVKNDSFKLIMNKIYLEATEKYNNSPLPPDILDNTPLL